MSNDLASIEEKTRRRRRGTREHNPLNAQKPFARRKIPFAPTEIISADELESIHNASLKVLEEVGIDFINDSAKKILKECGADVRAGSDRVYFDRGLIEEKIAKAPAEFAMRARNRDRDLVFGGNNLVWASVGSPPNCYDMDKGRRPGDQESYRSFLKLSQYFNIIDLTSGYPVEPVDLHASVRHLHCLRDIVELTDKGFAIYSLGRERNLDGMEFARLANGLSQEEFNNTPCVLSVINASSPLRFDTPMLQGIIEMSSRSQIIVITPFTLAGAMAPVTIAGALVQQNAEALAGIAFTQMVREGAPVIYGGFTSNVDMKSGAPAFGTPEYMHAALIGGQLARRYNLPYRSSAVCAANTVDAQAAYETVFSLWSTIQGGCNYIKHAAGWLEGGLTAGFEKFILDVDLLQMVNEFLQPVDMSEEALGVESIREVGPGGHFFGSQLTQKRYKDAFYAPIISDWRNYESWQEAGMPEAMGRANRLYKQYLADFEAPALDPSIKEAVNEFAERRIREGGVPTDF